MAVDYGLSIGMDKTDLILALLMVQFIGFPSALIFGKVAQVWHPKTGIYICIGTYIVAIIWAAFMQYGYEFYVLAGLIGIVQGGIQALSRSYFATLIPQSRAGEFFGFYNLLGKFAGLLGPLFIAAFGYMSGSSRIGIASLLILFLAGGLLLSRVKPEAVRS
jgi:UMF1 family MFS transporter